MSWYGDPEGLDRLAGTLASAAAEVRERAAAVRSPTTAPRWRGPAADAFRAAVAREAAVLDRAAGELEDAAAAVRRHAHSVRHELARLEALEHAVSSGLSQLSRLVR